MYEFTSRVRYSEIGPDGYMTPTALVTRMQDCGVFHCDSAHRGPEFWMHARCAWIVVSWQVIIIKPPKFGDRVITRTIPYRFHAFEGDRNYQIFSVPDSDPDAEPTLCSYTNSRWVWYDMEKQRPARVPQEEYDAFPLDPPLEMECAPRKIALPDTAYETGKSVEITETYIDTNGHVNNLRYIDLSRAYLPPEAAIRELRVEYMKQAKLGDVLRPKVFRTDGASYVLLETADGSPCTVTAFYY